MPVRRRANTRTSRNRPRKAKKKTYSTKRKWPATIVKPQVDRVAVRNIFAGSSFNSLGAIFPNKVRVGLKWNKLYTVAAGTSDIPTIKAFTMTGMFDPEVAAASSLQPFGFDNLLTHYAHYSVVGAKATITFVHNSGSAMIVGSITHPDTASTATYDTQDEFVNDPRSKYRFISNDRPRGVVKAYYSRQKIYGEHSSDSLRGNASSNPAENFFVSTYSNNMGPGNTQASYDMNVTIQYFAEFTEPLDITKS